MPARSQFWIRRMMRLSPIRCSTERMRHSCTTARTHQPVPEQGRALSVVVAGLFTYPVVPTNRRALAELVPHLTVAWLHPLRRRGQGYRLAWDRMPNLADDFLPRP